MYNLRDRERRRGERGLGSGPPDPMRQTPAEEGEASGAALRSATIRHNSGQMTARASSLESATPAQQVATNSETTKRGLPKQRMQWTTEMNFLYFAVIIEQLI